MRTEARELQQYVEAVHLELQHYTQQYQQGQVVVANPQRMSLEVDHNCCVNAQCRHSQRRKRKHSRHVNRSNESIKTPLPRQGTHLTNSSSDSFGQMRVVPLGRQRTGDTFNGPNVGIFGGSSGTVFTFDDRDGEPRPPQVQQQQPLEWRRRRTFWGDLCRAIKRYCCCCLFGGCCESECCEEWIYYFCGCCCSDSYLSGEEEDYARHMGYILSKNNGGSATVSSSFSDYHLDLGNTEIIFEEKCNKRGIAVPEKKKGDLNHSLLRSQVSNYSMDGVGANCMRNSMDQADPQQFAMDSDCH